MKFTVSPEAKQFFERAREIKQRHRIMTASEYACWIRGGDSVSSSSESNPFPGGLTIQISPDPMYIGRLSPPKES